MIRFNVNGDVRDVDAPPLARLLDVLRVTLGLTGTKEGCGEGECGACTVLLDGVPVNSCLVAAGQCEGRTLLTVEGLEGLDDSGAARASAEPRSTGKADDAPSNTPGAGAGLSPLQQCFIDAGGAQCGICTPGMLIAAEALLRENPRPNSDDVRDALAGNLCRCTGYQRIVDAVLDAAACRRSLASSAQGAAAAKEAR